MDDGPGRPPAITDTEILAVFQATTDPVLTASEIADQLSIGRRGVLARLDDLEERGFLRSKKVGGRSTVWWYPGHTATTPVEPDQ